MRRRDRAKLNDRGSAMLVAIVVSMVVIAFALSLLLVSYSLFASSVRKSTQTQCRELAKSVSIELEQEITTPRFTDGAEQDAAKASGKYPLWFYLRENLGNVKWPYYAAEKGYHIGRYAYRYFDLDVSGGNEDKYSRMADEISVCMYWTPEDLENPDELDNAMLTVAVTCAKGEQACTIVSYYSIAVSKEPGASTELWAFQLEGRE